MKAAVIIPARFASTRLPGKPLLRQTGKYLVQHVWERARQARRVGEVLVATDDPRIVAAVESFGGHAVLTRRDHPSGTDRVAEAARRLDLLPTLLEHDPGADMATLATPLASEERWRDPNCVKVVCDAGGRALYFSRSPIPFVRDGRPDFAAAPRVNTPGSPCFLQHLGLYAYRRAFLFELASRPPAALEQAEKLEQLRALAMGRRIAVGVVGQAPAGVDTWDDYERFVAAYRRLQAGRAA